MRKIVFQKLARFNSLAIVAMTCLLLFGLIAETVSAQRPIQHLRIRGDMAPGVAADMSRMADPSLDTHQQPVRIIAPEGTQLEVGVDEGYVHVNSSRVSLGMFVGPVYRLKVRNIPLNEGKELYPSIEILGKLSPPEGMENEFPIQVVVSQDDLNQAIQGNMVTKVVYLEDPTNAVPHKHLADEQPFFDVGSSTDPMLAAQELGRPVAILRIGSRIPTSNDRADFNFRAPEPRFLPDPQMAAPNPNWQDRMEFQPMQVPERLPAVNPPAQQLSLPPIVPGDSSKSYLNDQSAAPTESSILRRVR